MDYYFSIKQTIPPQSFFSFSKKEFQNKEEGFLDKWFSKFYMNLCPVSLLFFPYYLYLTLTYKRLWSKVREVDQAILKLLSSSKTRLVACFSMIKKLKFCSNVSSILKIFKMGWDIVKCLYLLCLAWTKLKWKLRMWKIRLRFKVLGQKLNALQFKISFTDFNLFLKLNTIISLFWAQPFKCLLKLIYQTKLKNKLGWINQCNLIV